jgi:hypothetical protein
MLIANSDLRGDVFIRYACGNGSEQVDLDMRIMILLRPVADYRSILEMQPVYPFGPAAAPASGSAHRPGRHLNWYFVSL